MTASFVKVPAGEKLIFQLSFDGGSTYTAPGTINTTRGITFTASASTDLVADMNNPSAPAKTVREITATDTKVDGAGHLNPDDLAQLLPLHISGTALPAKFIMNTVGTGSTTNAITVSGSYVCTQVQPQGTRGQKATVSLTFEQADLPTITIT